MSAILEHRLSYDHGYIPIVKGYYPNKGTVVTWLNPKAFVWVQALLPPGLMGIYDLQL